MLKLIMMAAMLVAAPAQGAEITRKGPTLFITGEIFIGDDVKLNATLRSKGVPKYVALNSIGGQVDTGISMAQIIYMMRTTTIVPPEGKCYSVCTALLAAGKKRIAYTTSSLGVHSVSQRVETEAGSHEVRETLSTMALTLVLSRILAIMEVPPHIIVATLATEGNQIYPLSASEVEGWIEIYQQ